MRRKRQSKIDRMSLKIALSWTLAVPITIWLFREQTEGRLNLADKLTGFVYVAPFIAVPAALIYWIKSFPTAFTHEKVSAKPEKNKKQRVIC